MRRAPALGLLLSFACAGLAGAQEDPSADPPALTWAAEVVGTLAPRDRGYFNETDYDRNALRLFRLDALARWQPARPVALLVQLRSDNLAEPEIQAAYLHLRPWASRAIDLQAGRIPPVFGAFPRRRYAADNPLIGYPLAYQYLVALRPDATPLDARDLGRARGWGWLPLFGVGSREERGGLPLVSALQYDTGVQAHATVGQVSLGLGLSQGSPASPRLADDNGGKQVSGRAAFRPTPGLTLGASAARGAYLADWVVAGVASAEGRDYHETTLGADAELSYGRWLARAEVVHAAFELPRIAEPHARTPVRTTAFTAEARYRLAAGLDLAARADHMSFGRLDEDTAEDWEAPLWRLEGVVSYSPARRLRLKAGYQHNWRDGGFVREQGFVMGQASWWF